MDGDRGAELVLIGLTLLLPLSALVARKVPIGRTMKMAAAWVAIFAIGLLIVSQRDRYAGLTVLLSDQQISGGTTRIAMSDDGHFWADVMINGVSRRMLIDSGATTTALSVATAKAAGIDADGDPFGTILNTANGRITAKSGTAARVTIGSVAASDLDIVTSPAFGDTDVIGMNFLSRLAGWRVEGRTLILTPRQQ